MSGAQGAAPADQGLRHVASVISFLGLGQVEAFGPESSCPKFRSVALEVLPAEL